MYTVGKTEVIPQGCICRTYFNLQMAGFVYCEVYVLIPNAAV